MKIKLDENLPARLVGVLSAHGHDVHRLARQLCRRNGKQAAGKACAKNQLKGG
ncbi:MAG: hypothetical protein Q8K23_08130 [Sulfuritalea sp.]|nr:hypothetical protein [Sulfuritalea sp.]